MNTNYAALINFAVISGFMDLLINDEMINLVFFLMDGKVFPRGVMIMLKTGIGYNSIV